MGRVLVIDDSHYARDILKKILQSGGHEVVGEAGDGEQGVEEYKRLMPDLVIVDMIMPKMGGVDAIRAIKKINNDVKILVISADGQEQHVEESVKAGALGYINKPYQGHVVLEEIEGLLHSKNR